MGNFRRPRRKQYW